MLTVFDGCNNFSPETVFPPVVGRRLQAQTAIIGERVILEAELVGNPEPTVTWYKDDVPIRSTPECRIKAQGDSHSIVFDKGNGMHFSYEFSSLTNPSYNHYLVK